MDDPKTIRATLKYQQTEQFKAMESHEQPRSGACRLAGRHAFDIPAKVA
jgi:hypothetical protein